MTTYKNLINFIDSLIRTDAKKTNHGYYLSWEEIDELDKQHIIALFIEYDDRDLYSVYQNQNYDDIVSSFINFLKKSTSESRSNFANCLKDNVVEFYSKKASELLEERLNEIVLEDEDEMINPYKETKDQFWATI